MRGVLLVLMVGAVAALAAERNQQSPLGGDAVGERKQQSPLGGNAVGGKQKKSTKAPVATPAPKTEPVAPTPEPAPTPPHVFTLGISSLRAAGMSTEDAALRTEVLAQKLGERGLKVLTQDSIGAVLGLERQKQLLGCAETSCLAELGAAMGLDALIIGSIGALEGRYSLTVKVVSSTNAATLASWAQQGLTARGLESALGRAAWEIADQLSRTPGHEAFKPGDPAPVISSEEPAATTRGSLRPFALVPGIVGLGGVIAGVVLRLQVQSAYDALSPAQTQLQASATVTRGTTLQTAEVVSFAVGGAFVATAVVMFLLGGSPSTVPIASFDSHGASFALTGSF
jgi:hypothetical protein